MKIDLRPVSAMDAITDVTCCYICSEMCVYVYDAHVQNVSISELNSKFGTNGWSIVPGVYKDEWPIEIGVCQEHVSHVSLLVFAEIGE